jgi:ribosomal protein S18 acetylase RimI-like enzyme
MIEDVLQNPDAAARRELLEVLARAFRDNPMNVEIHGPRSGRRVRANRAGLRALVLDGDRETISRVIRHDNEVVGGFVVAPPGLHFLPTPRLRRQFGCFIHQGARAMDRWGRVSHALNEFRPLFDHWYLSVLGVEPSLQGRGYGGRLIRELFALTASQPAPIYLESDRESSAHFYRACGFEDRTETTVLGVRCWCLGRGFPDESTDLCDSVRQA